MYGWAGVLQAGLTRTLNVLGRKSKALKEGEANLAGDHIREGLTCVVAVKVRLVWHAPSPAKHSAPVTCTGFCKG